MSLSGFELSCRVAPDWDLWRTLYRLSYSAGLTYNSDENKTDARADDQLDEGPAEEGVEDAVALPEHLDDLVAVLDVLLLHRVHVLPVQRFFDQQLVEGVHPLLRLEETEIARKGHLLWL